MCTGGRIRLFWGVSPDVMALALAQGKVASPFHFAFLWCPTKNQNEKEMLSGLVLLNIYIYIYSSYILMEVSTSFLYVKHIP